MLRMFFALCLFVAVAVPPAFAQTYADEASDWGVPATSQLVTRDYHSKTPISVPGAKTITTVELKKMLDGSNPPLVFDVLGGDVRSRAVIPGAIYLGVDAGDGQVYGAEKARFAKMLLGLTGGDKEKPMVFYCLSSHCWLSYNASLRALGEGYQNVLWYRGGFESWRAAGYALVRAKPYVW